LEKEERGRKKKKKKEADQFELFFLCVRSLARQVIQARRAGKREKGNGGGEWREKGKREK